MSNYWQDRFLDLFINLEEKSEEELMKEIAKLYKKSLELLKIKLNKLYEDIQEAIKDKSILASDYYRYESYYKLISSMNKQLKIMGEKQVLIFDRRLKLMYYESYRLVGDNFSLMSNPNPKAVKEAVENIWCSDGKHWSLRIWNNTTRLLERIERGLVDCVNGSGTYSEFVNMLVDSFNVSYHDANRLARTELIHIYTESTLDKYKDTGVDEVEFKSAEDGRTCEKCEELDGKIFDRKLITIGNNAPPIHPSCRCCLLPVIKRNKNNGNDR